MKPPGPPIPELQALWGELIFWGEPYRDPVPKNEWLRRPDFALPDVEQSMMGTILVFNRETFTWEVHDTAEFWSR